MTRHSPRLIVDLDRLIAADAQLAQVDALWRGWGFVPTSGRLWRCKDGSYTARVVWRNREAALPRTVTYLVRGLAFA